MQCFMNIALRIGRRLRKYTMSAVCNMRQSAMYGLSSPGAEMETTKSFEYERLAMERKTVKIICWKQDVAGSQRL